MYIVYTQDTYGGSIVSYDTMEDVKEQHLGAYDNLARRGVSDTYTTPDESIIINVIECRPTATIYISKHSPPVTINLHPRLRSMFAPAGRYRGIEDNRFTALYITDPESPLY